MMIVAAAVAMAAGGRFRLRNIDDPEAAIASCFGAGVLYLLVFGATLGKIIFDKHHSPGSPLHHRKRRRWVPGGQVLLCVPLPVITGNSSTPRRRHGIITGNSTTQTFMQARVLGQHC